MDVKINIEPGTKHGYSTIRISTNREKQWSVRASYNNWGDKATGEHLTSVDIANIKDVLFRKRQHPWINIIMLDNNFFYFPRIDVKLQRARRNILRRDRNAGRDVTK